MNFRIVFLGLALCFSALLKGQSVDSLALKDSLNYQLVLSAYNGDYQKSYNALKAGADVNVFSDDGITPLLFAINKGDEKLVKLLIDFKADVNQNADNYTSENPLVLATELGFTDIVELLLQHGAKVTETNSKGASVLHMAAANNDTNLVRMFLPRMDINIKNNYSQTPLMFAAYGNCLEVARILLENGADVNAIDFRGFTPLMFACENGYYNMTLLLLEYWAKVDAVNRDGFTPLALAITNKYSDVADLLMLNGAKATETYSLSLNPLVLAKITKQKSLADSLKKAGATRNYLPNFNYAVDFGIQTQFNDKDFLFGLKLLNTDIKYKVQWSLYYMIRPFSMPVLQKIDDNTFYQFRQRRQIIGLSLGKTFTLYKSSKNSLGIFGEGLYEYNFGKYKGTKIPVNIGLRLNPSAGVEARFDKLLLRLSVNYMKSRVIGPSDWNIGFSFMYSNRTEPKFNREIMY